MHANESCRLIIKKLQIYCFKLTIYLAVLFPKNLWHQILSWKMLEYLGVGGGGAARFLAAVGSHSRGA